MYSLLPCNPSLVPLPLPLYLPSYIDLAFLPFPLPCAGQPEVDGCRMHPDHGSLITQGHGRRRRRRGHCSSAGRVRERVPRGDGGAAGPIGRRCVDACGMEVWRCGSAAPGEMVVLLGPSGAGVDVYGGLWEWV